ncbi:nuclear transport factor 2 family protein [Microbacterium rhizophilus]|uniref:nuclear transport factor 2 family protein n=1 Tax=Microbacterium rhizophilus TaxID=3138934 RepID=UPI0031ED9D08
MLSLQEISDRLEIQDIYARYVHAVDDRELRVLEGVFEPDTVFDWTASGGERTTWAEAREGDFITGRLFPYVFHICVDVRIDFDPDGERANVKSKTIHPTGLDGADGTPVLFQVHGAYIDSLVRRPGGWRIIERVWQDFWAVGGLRRVDGIPAMLAEAAPRSDV